MTRAADVTKSAALILAVMAFVFLVAALPADLNDLLKELFLYAGLASGVLAVVVTPVAILANIIAWGARHASRVTR
jgi:hypothetical protein